MGGKCKKCEAFLVPSDNQKACEDSKCLDTRNKVLEDGTCEVCGDYEVVGEDKISCAEKVCDAA